MVSVQTEESALTLEDALGLVIPEGLHFLRDSTVLVSDHAKYKLPRVADIVEEFSATPILITGFAEKPADVKKKGDGMRLSLQRAMAVREALRDFGCHNIFACEGRGHADQLGGRCELRGISQGLADELLQLEDEIEGNPIAVAQREVNFALGNGIPFEPGFAKLREPGEEVIKKLSEVLLRYGHLGFRIVGYTARPGHKLTPDQATCKDLSLKRCDLVRQRLMDLGVDALIVTRGVGHVDDKGARLEVLAAKRVELEQEDQKQHKKEVEYEAKEEKKKADAQLLPQISRVVEVCFQSPRHKNVHDVYFTRKPLGLNFARESGVDALVVSHVTPGQEADRHGVKVGMSVRMVDGHSFAALSFAEAHKKFMEEARQLPSSA